MKFYAYEISHLQQLFLRDVNTKIDFFRLLARIEFDEIGAWPRHIFWNNEAQFYLIYGTSTNNWCIWCEVSQLRILLTPYCIKVSIPLLLFKTMRHGTLDVGRSIFYDVFQMEQKGVLHFPCHGNRNYFISTLAILDCEIT